MKKIAAGALILCMLSACALADPDQFVEDFNLFASTMYGLDELEIVYSDETLMACRSGAIEIMITDKDLTVYSDDPMQAVTAACCALRCIDNLASMIDQYGRVLHSYFLCKISGKEGSAVTSGGVSILTTESNGIYSIRLVK